MDEAFQNTCEVLWSKFHKYQPGSDFFAWSCSIARFEALRLLRAKGRDSRVFSDEFIERVADQVVEMNQDLDRQNLALAECFKALSPRHQKLIQLRYAHGGETKNVAERLGMSANAVYKLLRRVHEMLFACIQKRLAEDVFGEPKGTV